MKRESESRASLWAALMEREREKKEKERERERERRREQLWAMVVLRKHATARGPESNHGCFEEAPDMVALRKHPTARGPGGDRRGMTMKRDDGSQGSVRGATSQAPQAPHPHRNVGPVIHLPYNLPGARQLQESPVNREVDTDTSAVKTVWVAGRKMQESRWGWGYGVRGEERVAAAGGVQGGSSSSMPTSSTSKHKVEEWLAHAGSLTPTVAPASSLHTVAAGAHVGHQIPADTARQREGEGHAQAQHARTHHCPSPPTQIHIHARTRARAHDQGAYKLEMYGGMEATRTAAPRAMLVASRNPFVYVNPAVLVHSFHHGRVYC